MLLPYANLQLKHWNPEASAPLVLPVHVVCNTSDEDLHDNIRRNSQRPGKWVAQQGAHGRVAVLCGSGPSLADHLDEIKTLAGSGLATIFALNGAARYLHDHGLTADWQVMIDPRPVTADLVGPAKGHLFASQVHPSCFERAPNAILWHLQIDGIDDLLPKYDEPFSLLGGAASVGNTATVLAYALGYRDLRCYGYDSSHRGAASHAFRQSINDGEPCAKVLFNGREYITSLTMKLQAEKFQQTGRLLVGEGCKVSVHGDGLLPDIWNTPPEALSEKDKYERMWSIPDYRREAPGESSVSVFLDLVRPHGTVIDFGCGTGRGGLALSKAGLDVVLVDFASNCRDNAAMVLPFVELDLAEPMPIRGDYGYCTDVMEHIPPDKVGTVIRNIMECVPVAFFQIATVQDNFGAVINQVLHLTVETGGWWRDQFLAAGCDVESERETDVYVQFIVRRKESFV